MSQFVLDLQDDRQIASGIPGRNQAKSVPVCVGLAGCPADCSRDPGWFCDQWNLKSVIVILQQDTRSHLTTLHEHHAFCTELAMVYSVLFECNFGNFVMNWTKDTITAKSVRSKAILCRTRAILVKQWLECLIKCNFGNFVMN